MKKVKKCTSDEYLVRIREVLEHMAVGHTRSEIVRHAANKWGVNSRQVDTYMAEARIELLEINKVSLEDNLAMIAKNRWKLFREAVRKGAISDARNILCDIAKMHGLDQENVQHFINVGPREYEKLSDSELDKALAESH